jgi:hypothetical protein
LPDTAFAVGEEKERGASAAWCRGGTVNKWSGHAGERGGEG